MNVLFSIKILTLRLIRQVKGRNTSRICCCVKISSLLLIQCLSYFEMLGQVFCFLPTLKFINFTTLRRKFIVLKSYPFKKQC